MPIASFDEENKLVQETSVGGESQHFLGMSGWLVRKGLASNQTSADLTLVVLAATCIACAIAVPFFVGKGNTKDIYDPEVQSAIHPTEGTQQTPQM